MAAVALINSMKREGAKHIKEKKMILIIHVRYSRRVIAINLPLRYTFFWEIQSVQLNIMSKCS